MAIFYNPDDIQKVSQKSLVVDNNVLASCFSNVSFFKHFIDLFKPCPKLIDPIVGLEFLRGAYAKSLYKEKNDFLALNEFYLMIDHADLYKKVIENAVNISHVYSHNGLPDVDLGDILITARLMEYQDYFFLTTNSNDFPCFLFDRITTVSIEKETKKKMPTIEHIHFLKFNKKKYQECYSKLPSNLKTNQH